MFSSGAHETSFFLFSTFPTQFELCGDCPAERAEQTVLLLIFLPEVMSSP